MLYSKAGKRSKVSYTQSSVGHTRDIKVINITVSIGIGMTLCEVSRTEPASTMSSYFRVNVREYTVNPVNKRCVQILTRSMSAATLTQPARRKNGNGCFNGGNFPFQPCARSKLEVKKDLHGIRLIHHSVVKIQSGLSYS